MSAPMKKPVPANTSMTSVSARKLFGVTQDWHVPAFAESGEHVPEIDPHYLFDQSVTPAILAGFAHNRRTFIHGLHGTGKSTHIEQVAARLNWPLLRINLDSAITRTDLLGRDQIILQDGEPVTQFAEGLLPWALQNPVALVFDEYDAGRPDVMFVLQRVLEANGALTLLDQNRVIHPHPHFRLFATANTNGAGDPTGLYSGTHSLNQGQMDRWHITVPLDFMKADMEQKLLAAKVPGVKADTAKAMVNFANLARESFRQGELSTILSPRGVLSWAENVEIFSDVAQAFWLSFGNRCDESDKPVLAELYQRAFGVTP
jgi:cobaltochelatase CobS